MRMTWATVLAAGLSTAAVAQEGDDVIMLYGRVYLTAASVEAPGGANPIKPRTLIDNQASAFGVRATEILGDGLKAFAQLESSFKPDSNNSFFADRNSAIGLQGGWGTALMGRWDSPFKAATTRIDPYGDLTPSGITGVLNDVGNFNRRLVNVVQYWSPNIGGMVFRYSDKGRDTANRDAEPRVHSASLTWARGRQYAFVTWEQHEATTVKEKGLAAGGNYWIGPVRLAGQYQWFERNQATDARAWMANLIYAMGRNQLIGQYMHSKGGAAYGALQPDCNSWSVAYQYIFSNRTFVIVSYIRVNNNAAETCNFGANTLAIQPGQDPRALWAGLAHYF